MNLALAMVVIAEVCLGICAWRSSECLRWLAAHLLTRADVIDLSKAESKRRLQYWSLELGVEGNGFRRESSGGANLENGLVRPGTVS
jgi:hypothetical protein